jgi:hypothetical protein
MGVIPWFRRLFWVISDLNWAWNLIFSQGSWWSVYWSQIAKLTKFIMFNIMFGTLRTNNVPYIFHSKSVILFADHINEFILYNVSCSVHSSKSFSLRIGRPFIFKIFFARWSNSYHWFYPKWQAIPNEDAAARGRRGGLTISEVTTHNNDRHLTVCDYVPSILSLVLTVDIPNLITRKYRQSEDIVWNLHFPSRDRQLRHCGMAFSGPSVFQCNRVFWGSCDRCHETCIPSKLTCLRGSFWIPVPIILSTDYIDFKRKIFLSRLSGTLPPIFHGAIWSFCPTTGYWAVNHRRAPSRPMPKWSNDRDRYVAPSRNTWLFFLRGHRSG